MASRAVAIGRGASASPLTAGRWPTEELADVLACSGEWNTTGVDGSGSGSSFPQAHTHIRLFGSLGAGRRRGADAGPFQGGRDAR